MGLMKKTPPARLNVTLTNPQLAFLRGEAKRLGLSIGELVRRIIDQHREQRREAA